VLTRATFRLYPSDVRYGTGDGLRAYTAKISGARDGVEIKRQPPNCACGLGRFGRLIVTESTGLAVQTFLAPIEALILGHPRDERAVRATRRFTQRCVSAICRSNSFLAQAGDLQSLELVRRVRTSLSVADMDLRDAVLVGQSAGNRGCAINRSMVDRAPVLALNCGARN
jgi:hypothetical protein